MASNGRDGWKAATKPLAAGRGKKALQIASGREWEADLSVDL